MKLSRELLSKVAIGAGVSILGGLGLTGMAVYYGQQAINERRKPNNAIEEYGIWVGAKYDLLQPPPQVNCGMCGMG